MQFNTLNSIIQHSKVESFPLKRIALPRTHRRSGPDSTYKVYVERSTTVNGTYVDADGVSMFEGLIHSGKGELDSSSVSHLSQSNFFC